MADATTEAAHAGRHAERPWKLGKGGWKQVARRVGHEMRDEQHSLAAAGTAFFVFLAIFPALVALIALYGLFTDPAQIEPQVSALEGLLPASALDLLRAQMQRLAETAPGQLGISAIVGILVALWSANKGMKGMVKALNFAYGEDEDRNFLELNGVTLALTLGGIVFVAVLVFGVAVIPGMLDALGLGGTARAAIDWLRWPVLALILIGALAVLYHYGPDRDRPRWSWVTPGAVVATIVFLIASALFSLYVSMFGNYNEVYGSVGAVAVLMLWLYIGAWSVLLGAETNAEAERQTRRDTTIGRSELPRGGARPADTTA